MSTKQRFERYMPHLAEGLGHVDRHAGLNDYCTALMLALSRKSVEPLAAGMDPLHASARHQALHHFVAKADWSDDEMLRRVSQWVVPKMDLSADAFWIIDDTGFPKKVSTRWGWRGSTAGCWASRTIGLIASRNWRRSAGG